MTAMPTAEELARARREFAAALMEVAQQTAPLFDAADGIRADMQTRGWSPTAAEAAALTWLQGMLVKVTGGVQP